MEVRPATAEDAEAIAGVQERGWQRAYRHVFPVEELDRGAFIDPARWRQRFEMPPPGWATFVAERGEAIEGFVCLGPSRDEQGVGEIYAIYVDPDRWGHGIGRALLAEGERLLSADFPEATLWVLEANPRARRFYEAAGWRADGARKLEPVHWDVAAPEIRYRRRLATS